MQLKDLQAYEILEKRPIKDLNSEGIILRHKKSGARIAVISNDDDNKVFYIGFRTPPEDSTGVAHIIEHTVLCGSDKYPVKDPFVELVKGSLNTFLNAMTYPEKTIYPIASCNDKDFQNLMSVYMDAVFHPNIYKYQEIFQQEGWHYELESEDAPVTINGVVYNEMKGAFSSPDDVLSRQIMTSLFPDTTYANVSGGDPLHIPELTYEEYLDFHRRYYHPCNSYIYLYGDMDVAEKLAWMDEAYLGKYEAIGLDSEIKLQKPFEKPIEVTHKYSISSTESEENNTYLSYNTVIETALDEKLYLAFDILDYALVSAPGAPLKQALIDAGIGSEITGGYDSGTLQPTFSVIAKNTNPQEKEHFLAVIRETLEGLVKNGLNKTKTSFDEKMNDIFSNFRKVDENLLEELEEALIMSDMGVETSTQIISNLREKIKKEKIEESEQVKEALREEIEKILEKCDNSLKLETKPSVILVVGVNGVGKTTSIGKMAARLARDGKKVIVAAADTFRAAAVEQLEIWAQRAGAEVVKREEGVDPASVVFEAIRRTKESNADVLIIDTAGRLHNKKYLMDELNKIQKVVNKEMAEASKEVLLVIDATTGQNAISQVKAFKEQADITGIVLTKLDGTAKGGAVVGIVQENDIPVKFIGVGEQIDDMEIFNSKDFVKAII